MLSRLVFGLELIQLFTLACHQRLLLVELLAEGAELQVMCGVIIFNLGLCATLFIFFYLDERLFLLDNLADIFQFGVQFLLLLLE